MDALASECTSGCESGWTVYLEQSFLSEEIRQRRNLPKTTAFPDHRQGVSDSGEDPNDEDEEDLSMVSDASSCPAQFHEDEGYGVGNSYPLFTSSINGGEKYKIGKKKRRSNEMEDLSSFLDDTASSPAFDFSKSNSGEEYNQASMHIDLNYSLGFSSPFIEGISPYWHIQPSFSGNKFQNHN